jgi:hypothetical protein
MQKDPAERMESAGLLAEDLERWLLNKPIRSRRVSWREKSARWARRHRRSLAWGAVAVAGLALGIAEFWSFTHSRAAQAALPVPDSIITREGSRLVIRDVKGLDQMLWVSQRSHGRIGFREEGRYFQMPDGSLVLSTTDGISLKGVTHIVVDGGAGNDTIQVTDFEVPLPNLQINGGEGNDLILFWKPISFVPNAGLDADLQDDAPEPGLDSIQFNADTGTNYSWHELEGNGSVIGSYAATTTNKMWSFYYPTPTQTASVFAAAVIDILDYANTNKYKTVRTLGGTDLNGSGTISFSSSSWRNTNAVTSIKLLAEQTAFAQHSTFALYGVK